MSLRLKTILGIALIEAVLLAFLITMTLDYLRSTNYDGLLKRASTTASLVASTTKDAVLSYDLASLDAFTNEVIKNPDIAYARVLGMDGGILASASAEEREIGVFKKDEAVEAVDDGIFDTYAEITEGGVVYGRVELGLDISELNAQIAEAQRWSGAIASIEMVLVALFSFVLGAYLTGQIAVLQKASRRIAEGDLDVTIPVKGKDEVAELSAAFNVMTRNLRQASAHRDRIEEELKQLNRSLEARVKERTQDLESKNSELHQANAEIKQAQAQLLQSEKMASVGVLAAGVAHEINNPIGYSLSNIRTLSEYIDAYNEMLGLYERLGRATSEPERAVLLAQIQKVADDKDIDFVREDTPGLIQDSIGGIERVRDIVRELKQFSHVDSDADFTLYDLNECIDSTLKMAHNELKYHCRVHTDLGDIPSVPCKPGQINQVLLNIVINAGHAIEEQGDIWISSALVGGYVEISIRDSGKGIDPSVKDKLFDPFFTTKPVGQGTGLGLAISYGIMQEHKGDISVESVPGEGSCFTLRFPVVRERNVLDQASAAG